MNRILFNTQFEGSIPIVSEYQSLLDAVVASPAAVPVQHTNLIGIVTRTSWLRRRKGPVQEALDRLAGKAATTSDGKRTVEFQIITAEDRLDVHKLDNTHSQMLADIGEYIRVNVDLAAPGGQDYAHDLINRPQVFSEDVKGADGVIRKRVHFNGRPMHFAGWYFQKAFFVAIMTTKSGQNVFDLSGTEVVIASKKDALAACKRIRRDFAHNAMFFDGKLAGKPVLGAMPYVSRDGVVGTVPATHLPVEFPLKGGGTLFGWVRILHLDKLQLQYFDGQQQVDPYRMNELIQSWHPGAELLREGSGFKGTIAYCGGTFKGHSHCLRLGGKLNDTFMLLFDTKTEFRLKGDRITIGILDMIHQGGTVYTEPQMISNFLLGAADMIQQWNAAWLASVDEAMSNSAKCKALFCTIGKDALLPTTDDVVESDSTKRVAKFVLGTVYREASRTWTPLHTSLDWEDALIVAGSLDIDPTNHPALLKKLYWFLTNEMANLDDLRIPIPQDVAARRMMIVDPTVFGLGDGIYLNQGALAGNTVWFDGMERTVALTRQPSGSVVEHFITQAVAGTREFERFRGTPFIYTGVDVIVELMAILGGADQDDPAVVWFGAAIVEYFATVVAAKALEYAKLDGRSVDDVEALDNKVVVTKFEKFAASKAHTKFMGYDHRTTIFSLIEQMCSTDTNIGIAVNPGIVFNVLFWYGLLDGVPSMAPVTKNLERVIDAFQKTGERLNWLSKILDTFKKELPRMARFTADRVSSYTQAKRSEAGNPIAIVDTEFDAAVAAMHAEKEDLDSQFFEIVCKDHRNFSEALYEYVQAFLPGPAARKLSMDLLAAYRNSFKSMKATALDTLQAIPELARLSDAEKERIAGVQASRDACKLVFDQFVRQPLLTGAATKRQIWEAVLAMYRRVYAAGNDWAPGDTLLWSEEFSVVTIEALRYAKFLDEQCNAAVSIC